MILGSTGGTAGFGQFVFHHRPENAEALTTYIRHEDGHSWLQIDREPKLTTHYLDAIPAAVEELLKLEGLESSDIAAVFPPHLAARTSPKWPGASTSRARGSSKSTPTPTCSPRRCRMRCDHARRHQQVKPGDIGLIVSCRLRRSGRLRDLSLLMPMRLEGRSVLLTGATGGIGGAIAHELAARGCALTVTGRRTAELARLVTRAGSAGAGLCRRPDQPDRGARFAGQRRPRGYSRGLRRHRCPAGLGGCER